MNNLLQTLQTTYQQNPAAAISLLPDLFQAVEDGRVIEMPVKIGDMVYEPYPEGIDVSAVFDITVCVCSENGVFGLDDIGKIVFLTRAAAEQALKERDT